MKSGNLCILNSKATKTTEQFKIQEEKKKKTKKPPGKTGNVFHNKLGIKIRSTGRNRKAVKHNTTKVPNRLMT